jgi:hypothetical protein
MFKKQKPLFHCELTLYDSDYYEAGWVRFYVLGRTEPVGEYDLLIDGLGKLAQENDLVREKGLKQAMDEEFFTTDEVTTLHQYLQSSTYLKDRFPEAQWSPLLIEQFNIPIVEIGVRNDNIRPMSWRNTNKMFDMYQNCSEYIEHVDFIESDPGSSLPFHLMAEVILRYPDQDYTEDISDEGPINAPEGSADLGSASTEDGPPVDDFDDKPPNKGPGQPDRKKTGTNRIVTDDDEFFERLSECQGCIEVTVCSECGRPIGDSVFSQADGTELFECPACGCNRSVIECIPHELSQGDEEGRGRDE